MNGSNDQDYHKQDEFKRFRKRSAIVSAWQIQNLKFGAIVVRLQNNSNKIEALKKQGDLEKLKLSLAETRYRNRMIVKAFSLNINFCKVYFTYSQNTDSLLLGIKKGIFVDTNLVLDETIEMKENFYVLLDQGCVYQSSIGFIKEELAKGVVESGYLTGYCGFVFKNKYGHQLKDPFPYKYKYFSFENSLKKESVTENIPWENNETISFTFNLAKSELYPSYEMYANLINQNLSQYFRRNNSASVTDPKMKPFLY